MPQVRQDFVVPHLGGSAAVILFVVILFAFVVETQLTQYVQTNLGYRQPFFIFYLVHSSFALIFPAHLLYLKMTTNDTAASLMRGLSIAITRHLSPNASKFPRYTFFKLVIALTFGITCPALMWFAAISFSSIGDVTAIWNTNAFFAYLISVKVFNLKWEPRRFQAVLLATLGVAAVVYGGSKASDDAKQPPEETRVGNIASKPSAPLVGDLIVLCASFGYGLYQVLYKLFAALPSDPEVASDADIQQQYQRIHDHDSEISNDNEIPETGGAVYPPPFGFHPNFITSAIGLCTLLVLWIFIPILHILGIEKFRLPPNTITLLSIFGIALSGVAFNAGFMVLLGLWGPIIMSVGNLLTIVLVFLSDILFGSGIEAVTLWSVAGSSVIVAAFCVLAYDMFTQGS